MDSEKKKKKKKKANANREAELPIRFYIGEHRKKFVVSEELRKSSAYKNFMEAYRGELSFKGGKEPRGLSCSTAEFRGMLARAEAETKPH
jgi:hypothetical protein